MLLLNILLVSVSCGHFGPVFCNGLEVLKKWLYLFPEVCLKEYTVIYVGHRLYVLLDKLSMTNVNVKLNTEVVLRTIYSNCNTNL